MRTISMVVNVVRQKKRCILLAFCGTLHLLYFLLTGDGIRVKGFLFVSLFASVVNKSYKIITTTILLLVNNSFQDLGYLIYIQSSIRSWLWLRCQYKQYKTLTHGFFLPYLTPLGVSYRIYYPFMFLGPAVSLIF